MRTIHDHDVNPVNAQLEIDVLDLSNPKGGGACHLYQISGFNTASNPSDPFVSRQGKPSNYTTILFQNGPIQEFGVNGITHEALLAIVADRLRSFQGGLYACKENACALTHIEEAMQWLHSRTLARLRRGVEGTTQV